MSNDPNTQPDYWEPGPRLHARVATSSARTDRAQRPDRGRMIAAAILATALLVALGLYLLANVLADDDGTAPGSDVQIEQPE